MPDTMTPHENPAAQHAPLTRLFQDPALGAQRLTLNAGDVVFEPTTAADCVYFIQRGQVRLYQVGPADARLDEILGPEEWFGVGALARSQTQDSRAVAVGPTTLLAVSIERLVAALTHRPHELLELNRQLAAKLQGARDDAARLVFDDCNARLIRTLLTFSRSAAASAPSEDEVVLRITHDQLAQAVGVARETVSLALTQLRHQNLLRTGRNQLVFNPEALRQFRGARARNGEHKNDVQRVAS